MEIQTKQQEKPQGSDTSCSRFSQVTYNTKWGSGKKKYAIKHQKYPLFCRIFLFSQVFSCQIFSATQLHLWSGISPLKTSSRLTNLFLIEATKPTLRLIAKGLDNTIHQRKIKYAFI